MGTHRTPTTEMFAVEMARACLPQVPGFRDSMWLHMTMEMGEGDNRAVSVAILICSMDESFFMDGEIFREDGIWTRGSCTVHYGNDRETTWSFTCARVENRLEAKMVWATLPPSSHPPVPNRRVDDKELCACGEDADGKVNWRGKAACSEWPDCVLD